MNISTFLKQQLEKKEKQDKETSDKENFRQKCIQLLGQIKEINEERHQELNKLFHQGYDKINIQRKKLLGLHGQLVHELKILREKAGMTVDPARQSAQKVIDQVKGGAKQVQKNMEEMGRAGKKMANQMITEVKAKPALKEKKKDPPKTAKKASASKKAEKTSKKNKASAKSPTKKVAKKSPKK